MGCAVPVQSKAKFERTILSSPRLKQLDGHPPLLSNGRASCSLHNLSQDFRKGSLIPLESQEIHRSTQSTKSTLLEASDLRQLRKEDDLQPEVGNVLYYLDENNFKLYFLHVATMEWRCNDLKKAEVVTPLLGRTKMSKVFLNMLHLQSAAFVSTTTMRFIGTNHFDYDTEENCFYKRDQMNNPTIKPLLAFSTNKIYAISGKISDDELSNNFEEYDLQTGIWTTLPNLPGPHFGGSCTFAKTSSSIIVMGGFQSFAPESYNPFISVFDTINKKWSRIPLEELAIRVPKLMMNTQILEYNDGKFLLFGTESRYKYYKLDLKRKKLVAKGNLPITTPNEGVNFQITKDPVSNDFILSVFQEPIRCSQGSEEYGVIYRTRKPYAKWHRSEN